VDTLEDLKLQGPQIRVKPEALKRDREEAEEEEAERLREEEEEARRELEARPLQGPTRPPVQYLFILQLYY
jgi:hypothetical protein